MKNKNTSDHKNHMCEIFKIWDVWDVGCSGCGMFEMWDVWDVGCLGCEMWHMVCFSGFWILIYKIPCYEQVAMELQLPSVHDLLQAFLNFFKQFNTHHLNY